MPDRSTVTIPAPHRPAGADFSSSAYTGFEVHSVSFVQWISGVLSERVERPPYSASVEKEWCSTFALPVCLHGMHTDYTVLNKGLFQGG